MNNLAHCNPKFGKGVIYYINQQVFEIHQRDSVQLLSIPEIQFSTNMAALLKFIEKN